MCPGTGRIAEPDHKSIVIDMPGEGRLAARQVSELPNRAVLPSHRAEPSAAGSVYLAHNHSEIVHRSGGAAIGVWKRRKSPHRIALPGYRRVNALRVDKRSRDHTVVIDSIGAAA